MKALITRFVREDEGQDLIEYALLAAFIAVVSIAMITAVGIAINSQFSNVNDKIK